MDAGRAKLEGGLGAAAASEGARAVRAEASPARSATTYGRPAATRAVTGREPDDAEAAPARAMSTVATQAVARSAAAPLEAAQAAAISRLAGSVDEATASPRRRGAALGEDPPRGRRASAGGVANGMDAPSAGAHGSATAQGGGLAIDRARDVVATQASPEAREDAAVSASSAARLERQAAVVAAVSRMTLRHGTHAEVDVPALGRVSVDVRGPMGALDVSVQAARPEALRALEGARASLETELREASVRVGHLEIRGELRSEFRGDTGSDPRPDARSWGGSEQRDARSDARPQAGDGSFSLGSGSAGSNGARAGGGERDASDDRAARELDSSQEIPSIRKRVRIVL